MCAKVYPLFMKSKWMLEPSGNVYDDVAREMISGATMTAYWIPFDEENTTCWDSESGIGVASVNLLLESTTTIRFYFNLDGTKSIDEYTFYVDGVETIPVQSGENQYYVDKVNVAAKDLDEMVTVTVGGLTVKYCGLSYVRQVAVLYPDNYSEALVNVAKALYAYNQAANAYFA